MGANTLVVTSTDSHGRSATSTLTISASTGPVVPPPPPPPPVTGHKTAFGLATDGSWAAMVSQVGLPAAHRTYNQALPSDWAHSAASSDAALGVKRSQWSWKPNIVTFPSDKAAQAALRAFVLSKNPNDGTVVEATAFHEPQDDIAKGSFTYAQWRAAQYAIGSVIKSCGRHDWLFGPITMGNWTFSAGGIAKFGSPDQLVDAQCLSVWDFIGHDVYLNIASKVIGYEKSTDASMLPCEQFNAAHGGKPLSIGEFACNEYKAGGPVTTKAAELNALLLRAQRKTQNLVDYLSVAYFDVKGVHYGADPTYLLRSSASSTAAWKAVQAA